MLSVHYMSMDILSHRIVVANMQKHTTGGIPR
jgi:hypothetical protein